MTDGTVSTSVGPLRWPSCVVDVVGGELVVVRGTLLETRSRYLRVAWWSTLGVGVGCLVGAVVVGLVVVYGGARGPVTTPTLQQFRLGGTRVQWDE